MKIDEMEGFFQKALFCIRERKVRDGLARIRYCLRCTTQTFLYNIRQKRRKKVRNGKYLYASAVNAAGKRLLAKIVQRLGADKFDYLIFIYDDTIFNEPAFKNCVFIREKGFKWYFAKKYMTPEYCAKYDHIFFWDDDIDIENFSYRNFIDIMERNNLEMAQPALTAHSYHTYTINRQNRNYKIGRYTDYVEIMVPIFSREAWGRFWGIIESGYNFWGWGYDALARSFCRYNNMGIVDCEPVTHVRKAQETQNIVATREMDTFLIAHERYIRALRIAYGHLR